MTDFIVFISGINKAIIANPVLAGFGIYITGLLTWIARDLPRKVWDFIVHQLTTRMEMNSGGYANEQQFNNFLQWYMKSPWAKHSRTLYSGGGYVDLDNHDIITLLGPGLGNHFFFFKKRLFWFRKSKVEKVGIDKEVFNIDISTFGRSHQSLIDLLSQFRYKTPENRVSVYDFSKEWRKLTEATKRNLDSVFIDPLIKTAITNNIDRFVNQPEWYHDKGLAYKLTFLLTGLPGTGKTSLIKAFASHYKRNVCILDMSAVSNGTFRDALTSLPKNSILVIEDIDAAGGAINNRDEKGNDNELEKMVSFFQGGLTLSGILNTLDGIVELNGVIIFMTTNHPEKLDPALLRKSRIDFQYEIKPMGNKEIRNYITKMYPDFFLDNEIIFGEINGCDIKALYMEYSDDPETFIKHLIHERQPFLVIA